MLEFLANLIGNPAAPVPAWWPLGWRGVLLLFTIPGGLGVPPGVLLGAHGGLGIGVMTLLYVVSDVVLALVFEPLVRATFVLGRRSRALARAGTTLVHLITRTLPRGTGGRHAGVVLTGFGMGLPFGRSLAAAMGYRLLPSWVLTIAGDVGYFALGMASVLWFDGMFDDQRVAALAALIVMVVTPPLLRVIHGRVGSMRARRRG